MKKEWTEQDLRAFAENAQTAFEDVTLTEADEETADTWQDDGLQVDYCQKHGITCVLRGLRNQLDLLYERDVAISNHQLGGLETLFLLSSPQVSHISSSVVRELIAFSADLSGFVPECVKEFYLQNMQ